MSIATDHGGFGLKEELTSQLGGAGQEVIDFGSYDSLSSVKMGICTVMITSDNPLTAAAMATESYRFGQ